MNLFASKAPWIMAALMKEFGLELLDAGAILGNLGHECAGFESLAQKNGNAYGWPQWDGVRKTAYLAWCRANALDPASDEANYRYLVLELKTTEKRALPAVKNAVTLDDKVRAFEAAFERAGVKHYPSRIEWAGKALDAYNAAPRPITLPVFAGGKVGVLGERDVAPGPAVVPPAWMQRCAMKRVIAHWSAGRHQASDLDRKHYHIIVEGDGRLVKGDHDIADNIDTGDGNYAAHTRGTNTGSIGIALACMGGQDVRKFPFSAGPWPMTRVQWNAMIGAIADLVTFYGIPVTRETVLSHAEVQGTLGIKQAGKWDFTRLAFDPAIEGAQACGDRMRADVLAAIARRKAALPPPARPVPEPADEAPDVPAPPVQPGKSPPGRQKSGRSLFGWLAGFIALAVLAGLGLATFVHFTG